MGDGSNAPNPEGPPSSHWVVTAEFGVQERARLLAGRLEAEGIPTLLEPEWASTHYGPSTSAFLGRPFSVLVPEDRLEDARALIREIEAG